MIRLTRQADYGILLLTRIASGPPRAVHAARDLADETRLPLPTVSKILKALAKEGLLQSHRGVKGGYSLARTAQSVSLADIVEALEGPIAMTDCLAGPPSDCEHHSRCTVQHAWKRINAVVMKALEGVTLAEMCGPPQQVVKVDLARTAGALAD